MRKFVRLFCVVAIAGVSWQCRQSGDFKEIHDLKNNEWPVDSLQTFVFTIEDVSVPYNVHYLIRNAQQYPFYNLYVTRTLTDSTGKVLTKGLEEVILFDTKTGKPFGSGLGDIFDHKFRLRSLSSYRFPQPGKYTLTLEQKMRQDPLLGIMSVGLTVEAAVVQP